MAGECPNLACCSVRWQREIGLIDRIARRWYASKPRCESGGRGFMAIGIREVCLLLGAPRGARLGARSLTELASSRWFR